MCCISVLLSFKSLFFIMKELGAKGLRVLALFIIRYHGNGGKVYRKYNVPISQLQMYHIEWYG